MRLSLRFPLLLTLTSLALASPFHKRWDDIAEKHSWVEIPKGWEFEAPAPKDYMFDLRIALKQHKIEDLIANLMETSDPFHPRYGQHLTPSEAESFVAAHPTSHTSVADWLNHYSIPESAITRFTGGGDWVNIRLSVAEAERLLNTQYNIYTHSKSGERVVRSLSYSLPRELHSHIGVVVPTTYFGTVRSMRATHFVESQSGAGVDAAEGGASEQNVQGTVPVTCNTKITPSCLRGLYNTATYTVVGGSNNTIGVAGYLDEYANRADLQTFFSSYRPDAVGSSYTTQLVNGGLDDQSNPGVEANLDIQYTTGMAYPIPHIYYSTGGSPPFNPDSNTPTNTNEPYLDWLNYVLSQPNIPQVVTTSYGDDEQTVPSDYALQVCNLFAQLGSVGTSVFFSSGDSGVGGGSCTTNDGTNRVLFQPEFPSSCPYVTSVGATTKTNPEVVASFSGGGFSRYFAQPSYQSSAVSAFLTRLGSTYSGKFNSAGRAYPDIAAQGTGFQVVIGGFVSSVGGTSASSPTAAAIFGLLNDVRLSSGKTSLGFLNPLIYSTLQTGFNDITSGSNPGCGTNGFSAGTGWDPITGFGTPDFAKLKALI